MTIKRTVRRRATILRTAIGALAAAALLLGAAASPAHASPLPAAPGPLATCQQQSFLEGDHYSAVQIAQLAKNAGFSGQGWTISVAVALAESAGWTHARLINTDCSVDRGLWQINSYWHSEVPDWQAFDPAGAAQAAYAISSGGSNWQPWVTYTNGAYQAHMAEAQAAVNQVGGGGGGGNPPPPGNCSGPAWSSSAVYWGGDVVSYGGHSWKAKWWTQGETPGTTGQWGVWQDLGAC